MKHVGVLLLMLSLSAVADEGCGSADSRFDLSGNGTVKDKQNKLEWMQCSLGMVWGGGECTGRAERHDWHSLQSQLEQVNSGRGFANHNDWRLPTQAELETLIDKRCYDPVVNGNYFARTVSAGYWTSSPYMDYDGGMMLVYFLHGQSYVANKDKEWFVRLVRK